MNGHKVKLFDCAPPGSASSSGCGISPRDSRFLTFPTHRPPMPDIFSNATHVRNATFATKGFEPSSASEPRHVGKSPPCPAALRGRPEDSRPPGPLAVAGLPRFSLTAGGRGGGMRPGGERVWFPRGFSKGEGGALPAQDVSHPSSPLIRVRWRALIRVWGTGPGAVTLKIFWELRHPEPLPASRVRARKRVFCRGFGRARRTR
jgi:hypothetical protein